jgi:hypothetical protein
MEFALGVNHAGVTSNADGNSASSVAIAAAIATRLETGTGKERLPRQISGRHFERICTQFVRETFLRLKHLRAGDWEVHHVGNGNCREIAKYQQYSHLRVLDLAARGNPGLAAALGNDYTITPDIIVSRRPVLDSYINGDTGQVPLIDRTIAQLAYLRKEINVLRILHASISCKWKIRSDHAQNARSETLNLIRNRKGRLPHTVVVTAEPTPGRLASIALGTGDIDCAHHFALHELQEALELLKMRQAQESLAVMVEGRRLKDISDLPLDMAV